MPQSPEVRRLHYHANRDKIRAERKAKQKETSEKRRAYMAKYYLAHSEEIRERSKERFWAHREEERIRNKQYRESHQEEIRKQRAQYRDENQEEIADRNKRYYEENKEQIAAQHKEYALAHAEEDALRHAIYRAVHAEEIRQHKAAYYKENPQLKLDSQRRRRARKKQAAIIDLSEAQWQEVLTQFQHRCAYCPPTCKACKNKTHTLTQDHISPLGPDGPHTLWNVVPACASHNSQKGDRAPLNPVQPLLLTMAPSKPLRRKKT